MRDRIVAALVQEYKNRILIFITHDKYIIDLVDEVIDLEEWSSN
jgi:ABC-type lipoprotein export system ATPase subunit